MAENSTEYECPDCTYKTTDLVSLTRHQVRIHGDEVTDQAAEPTKPRLFGRSPKPKNGK